MDMQHARDVNRRLCDAWFVLHGITPGPLPRLVGIRIDEARQAIGIVRQSNAYAHAAGGETFVSTLTDAELPRLFASLVVAGQAGQSRSRPISPQS